MLQCGSHDRGRYRLKAGPLAAYFESADGYGLLSADQEKTLGAACRAGDREARDRMIRANLRLVVQIAKPYAKRGMDFADLVQEGNCGLIVAAERFNPAAGTRFSTYATYWIRRTILNSIMDKKRPIRVPRYLHTMSPKWEGAKRSLSRSLGREPSDSEIAERAGIGSEHLPTIRIGMRVLAAEFQRDIAGKDWIAERIPSDRNDQHEPDFLAADTRKYLLKAIAAIDGREAEVIWLRFGLGEEPPMTLAEIGRHLGYTRERIRQIEAAGLKSLRKWIENN